MGISDNLDCPDKKSIFEKGLSNFSEQQKRMTVTERSMPSLVHEFQSQSIYVTYTFLSTVKLLFDVCRRLIIGIVDCMCPSFKSKFQKCIKMTGFFVSYLRRIVIINIDKIKRAHQQQPSIPGLCGLINIGNTCYMNSAVQCLSNIPRLTQWAIEQEFQVRSENNSVTRAYTSLLRLMWSGNYSSVNPQSLKQQLGEYASIFHGCSQSDAHELMNSLLNALHQESHDCHIDTQQCSIIDELFLIHTESRVECTACEMSSSTRETTYCLPLPLDDGPTETLDALLTDFLKENLLSGLYFCLACENLTIGRQKTSLCLPLPPVIIIQLKRFKFDNSNDKITTFVDYPIMNWNLTIGTHSERYDLISFVTHTGNLKDGHYRTFARLNGDGPWYSFNDQNVETVCDTQGIVNENAYILVYLKQTIENPLDS